MPLPPEYEMPPEPELPFRIYNLGLEHHATAIGYLCFEYAKMELQLSLLIQALLRCSGDARRAIVDATGASITTRCTLIKKLSYTTPFSEKWREVLSQTLDHITKHISPDRNRLVHDMWIESQGKPMQMDFRVFERREGSRAPKSLSKIQQTERELQGIWGLVEEVVDASFDLSCLHFDILLFVNQGVHKEQALQSIQNRRSSRRPSQRWMIAAEVSQKQPRN